MGLTPRERVMEHYAACPTCEAGDWCSIADGLEDEEVRTAALDRAIAALGRFKERLDEAEEVVADVRAWFAQHAPPEGPFNRCVLGDPWCACDGVKHP